MSGDIPAGMTIWRGGDAAPADWDGGPVLHRSGWLGPTHGDRNPLAWGWDYPDDGMPETDIIAYTPKPTLATERPAPSGDVAGLVQGLNDTAKWIRARDPLATNYLYLVQAADALTRLSGEGWQDIATAPKDGRRVLGWVEGPFKAMAVRIRWDDDRYASKPRPFWASDDQHITGKVERRQHQPTHWRPLPAAPEVLHD